MNFREKKIEELKETSFNRDFSQGGTSGGVTSGAAIAVLQESGNKTSRDATKESYRTYKRVIRKVIERMRQFYDSERVFRIVNAEGKVNYTTFSNSGLLPQSMGVTGGKELFRKPIFDIEIKAQKQNPYSTLSQNETIMNLYNAGVFNPENAQMAMTVLELMNFEGKKEALEYVKNGATLQNQLMQLQEENKKLLDDNIKMQKQINENIA
jgi:hypothetical protein